MKLSAVFLILILIFGFSAVCFAEDPLLLVYQDLKIGMERGKVYEIVGNYYPGQMAKVHYNVYGSETWNWSWPPGVADGQAFDETSYLWIDFSSDSVSDVLYKYVSPLKIEFKRIYK